MNNAIDYISVYKQKGYSSIKIPLIVTLDGNYKFENIVIIKMEYIIFQIHWI